MKKGMNPRKKYAAGTTINGVKNYIPNPADALAENNRMMAEAEMTALQNPWLPIVSIAGGLASNAIGSGVFKSKGGKFGGKVEDMTVSGDVEDTTNPEFQSPIAANGMNNVNADVEVEGGEMYETPQGETGEFQGPSHEQGGIPMEVNEDIPEGTKVYSDRLKVGKETLAERKAKRERQIANLEKIASESLVDSAVKNATQRKMAAIQKEEMADLQFQEQVNNMQQMADTVVKAFGTSMTGVQENPIGDSMRYGYGTNADGVTEYGKGTPPGGINYGKGYNADMFKDFFTKYNQLNPGGVLEMGAIQGDLGIDSKTEGFGTTFGPGTYMASQNWLAKNRNKKPDEYVKPLTGEQSLANNPNINLEALKNFQTNTGINDNASLNYGNLYAEDGSNVQRPTDTVLTPADSYGKKVEGAETTDVAGENPSGTMLSRGLNKMANKIGDLNEKGFIPGLGDMTSLFGNYLGATSGLKNAASQRASDITHTNVYKNAGKESQKQLDNAMSSIEGSKAQAIIKATSASRGGKKGGRGSARGINQMRTMDWLYDTALNQQIADISANAAAQVSDIFKTKASTALSADQLSGEGQFKANMANEAAKDAYYTARGLGLKDQSMAVQQTGKDLNAMKQNKIIENLMKNYGTYGQVDPRTGLISNKAIPGQTQTQPVYTLNGKKYTTDSSGNLKLV